MGTERRILGGEEDTLAFGAEIASIVQIGDTVLLSGPLGAGKTTLARGVLRALGHEGAVRSPTFQLLAVYDLPIGTVVHADLYRLKSSLGVGLEDYLGYALCLVEWPDRLADIAPPGRVITIEFAFEGEGRVVDWSLP